MCKGVLTFAVFGSVTAQWFNSIETNAESLYTKALFFALCREMGNQRINEGECKMVSTVEHLAPGRLTGPSTAAHRQALKMMDGSCTGTTIILVQLKAQLQKGNLG